MAAMALIAVPRAACRGGSACEAAGEACSLAGWAEEGEAFVQQLSTSQLVSLDHRDDEPWAFLELAAAPTRATAPAPAPPAMGLLAGAPMPDVVRKHVAKTKADAEAKARGDLHFTLHNCHCFLDWEWEGEPQKGCSKVDASFSKGHAWCKVVEPCDGHAGTLGPGEGWDFCSLPGEVVHEQTAHGCHCAPHWEFEGQLYDGCSRTSLGPRWCYVFEGDDMCPEAMRTDHGGQHWDHCFIYEQTSPYLTKHGCHCMPEWTHNDEKYLGCARVEKDGAMVSWCITEEDEADCPQGGTVTEHESVLRFDTCSIVHGTEDELLPTLATARSSACHCQPEWEHNGLEYRGCASTPDRSRKWCYVLEDARECPEADGTGEGDAHNQRWRYCDGAPGAEEKAPPVAPAAPPASASHGAAAHGAAHGAHGGHGGHGLLERGRDQRPEEWSDDVFGKLVFNKTSEVSNATSGFSNETAGAARGNRSTMMNKTEEIRDTASKTRKELEDFLFDKDESAAMQRGVPIWFCMLFGLFATTDAAAVTVLA